MIRSSLPIIDIVLVLFSFLVIYLIRVIFFSSPIQPIEFYIPFIFVSIIFSQVAFSAFSIYDNHRSPLSLSYLVDFLKAVSFWGVAIIVFAFLTKTDYSRMVTILHFFVGVCYFL